jgi:hypothetical protein
MNDESRDEYSASIGSVIDARKQFAAVSADQGPDSVAAQEAQDHLTHEIEHRDEMRIRHDATAGERAES